jgi:hypothetical protein
MYREKFEIDENPHVREFRANPDAALKRLERFKAQKDEMLFPEVKRMLASGDIGMMLAYFAATCYAERVREVLVMQAVKYENIEFLKAASRLKESDFRHSHDGMAGRLIALAKKGLCTAMKNELPNITKRIVFAGIRSSPGVAVENNKIPMAARTFA